jgi:hypothetical protein
MAREVPKAVRTWFLLGGLSLAGAGCMHHNWDEITSRDFKIQDLYKSADPMAVLRENPDGDARAKAMNRLKEPAKNGHAGDQDEAVAILSKQAVTAPEPLCRLAAINALGRFDDPRTTVPLIQAYHNAANEKTFTPDLATQVRTAALTALGHKSQPEALALLVQAASVKPESKPGVTQPVSFSGEPSRMDSDSPAGREVRLAAVRALGMSKNSQAIPVLLPHLSDKDVAIRDEAHKSLEAITGRKNVQPTAEAWRAAIAGTDKVDLGEGQLPAR